MRSWVDRFVPTAARADPEALRRARLMVVLAMVLIVTGAVYSAFYGLVARFIAGSIITGCGAAVAAAVLPVLRTRPSLHVGGHALTGVLYVVLAALMHRTGGVPSPITPWLVLPPMFAALLLGQRSTVGWTTLCVLTIATFHAAALGGMRFTVGYAAEWATTITFASYAGLVALAAILVGVFENTRVEAQLRAEVASAALARLAYHDALTGLTNRARFVEALGEALTRAHAADDAARVAVLLLDLDRFKEVNDSLGHGAGDAVLAQVATRLLSATRGCDTVARIGGDEFAVLLCGVREDAEAAIVAQRIVAAMEAPFVVGRHHVSVGTSLGVARGTPTRDAARACGDHVSRGTAGVPLPCGDVAALLHDADVAMYRAKALGKGRWVRYEAGMVAVPAPFATPRLELERRVMHG
jgi:diguanylate cyclase (GGDEF)-like protein